MQEVAKMKWLTKIRSTVQTLLITAINKNYQMEVWTTITTTTTTTAQFEIKLKCAFSKIRATILLMLQHDVKWITSYREHLINGIALFGTTCISLKCEKNSITDKYWYDSMSKGLLFISQLCTYQNNKSAWDIQAKFDNIYTYANINDKLNYCKQITHQW